MAHEIYFSIPSKSYGEGENRPENVACLAKKIYIGGKDGKAHRVRNIYRSLNGLADPLHEYTDKIKINATCINKGYTENKCNCGECYRDNYTEDIDPNNHNKNNREYLLSEIATCAWGGYTKYKCLDCNNEYEDDYTDPDPYNHVDHTPEVTSPTCTEQGYTTWTCACGEDSYTNNYIDALGHAWSNGEPTCTESVTLTCLHGCGGTLTIPAKSHTEDPDNPGYCKDCGVYISD